MPNTTTPSAKRLILSLMAAPELDRVPISTLLLWGQLFDIDAPTIRVTVGRLLRQGVLASPSRGVYEIGLEGKLLADTARGWIRAENRIVDWQGDWLLVHTAHLGRSNKTALRARERAFRLNGFASWQQGLYCRPANLNQTPMETREQLLRLGLEDGAIVIKANDLPGTRPCDLQKLWPRKALESAYRNHIEAMRKSIPRLPGLSIPEAARESMHIGEAVIRQVTSDPMLPEQMVDSTSRRQMIELMIEYDSFGRDIWRQLIDQA